MSPTSPDGDDPDGPYTFCYDAEADYQPTMAIVEAMAWIEDTDLLELPPLYHAIDVGRVNGLFGRPEPDILYRSSSDSTMSDHTVSFEYEGRTVEVTPDVIRIHPA